MQKLKEGINSMNPRGVITKPSPYSVKETIDRLQAFLQQHGATVYARIDQQAELQTAGINIPPLEFIMFGNPKAGGPVMAENPITALDLPLKVIAWEDDQKNVFIAYNDVLYIEERYLLSHNANSPLKLDNLITMALKP
jgi:uncharacterized protein (DUF302 family)